MAETRITVHINDRDYPLACAEGDEDRITALAARIDAIAKRVPGSATSIGEARLLVMVALILADQLDELERTSKANPPHATKSTARGKPNAKPNAKPADGAMVTKLTEQIESIASHLETLAENPPSPPASPPPPASK